MSTKLFRLILVSIMLCTLLTSCFLIPDPNNQEDPTVTYKVTFLNGDELIKTVEVNAGETVSEPHTPTKEPTDSSTFVFDGWYNGEAKWDFNNKVESDLTLNAKFEEIVNVYEVKILDINRQVVTTLNVVHGEKIEQPETPESPVQAGAIFTFDG